MPQSLDNLEETIVNDPAEYQRLNDSAMQEQKAINDRMRFLARY